MINKDIIFRSLGGFILDRKELVIRFLNENGYAELPNNTPIDEVNKAVADNMLNDDFIAEFVFFQRRVEEGEYSNWVIAVAQLVVVIATSISGMVTTAKNKIFGEDMARRQEQYNKETNEWYKEQAALQAKKQIAIELGKAQTDLILSRDMAEEKAKTMNNLLIFGVAVAGALTIAYMLRKNKK
jgi:hypothetical protein